MRSNRILILGGTADARKLAEVLHADFDVTTSLAGVTTSPLLPTGTVRRGGFGGEAGLARYAKDGNFAVILDATHPFAAQISRHATAAAQALGIPCLRLERPEWPIENQVRGVTGAVAALPAGARAFVTIGRKDIAPFFARADISGVARMIEPPAVTVPPRWKLILARPPFSLEGELDLIEAHGITHLVAKNAGGDETSGKLAAAALKNLTLIMIARPPKPAARTFATPAELAAALRQLLSP